MRFFHLVFLICILAGDPATGQEFPRIFGQISKEEMELKQYPPDRDAEALVLFDIGSSHFVKNENTFDVIFERVTRIKILSEAGLKWAEVEIPFYQEGNIYENVYDIEVYTYNYENGGINRSLFNVTDIYVEKLNKYWNVKKFAIPNVKVGSVIEYRYKINSQYKFNLRDWEFQWTIPVVYSEYEVRMIPFYEYSWLLQGASKFDSRTSYEEHGVSRQFGPVTFHDMVHKFVMKNIPAFDNEEFITSKNDYIIKLDFQLSGINTVDGKKLEIITTWEDMIKELLKHKDFGKYVSKSEKISSKLLDTENAAQKSDKEKFDYAIEYVKRNFNWNHHNGKYATKTPNKFIEEKHGNCADINLFAVGLLNAMGIEAYPVIISTRENGKIKYNYPYTHFFDYVIILANVEGKKILTDATDISCLNNRIPPRCINDKGLIIKKDHVEWALLECSFPSVVETSVLFEDITEKTITTRVSMTATEYDALYYRKHFSNKIETIRKKLDSDEYSVIDTTISVLYLLNKDKPYTLKYKQTSIPETVNGKIYLSPFLDKVISDNPLKQKERTYPVDMTYPKKRVFKTTLIIPEGYQVDFIPAKLKIDNPLFGLTYSAEYDGKRVNVYFDYYFKNSVYSPRDYPKIKYYFTEIVKKGNEKVVLSKKTL